MTPALPDGCDGSPLTVFQERVYATLCQVPAGTVVTYGELARAVGCGSAQAIGQALRRNPFAPTVPCHRVVAADRTIGGFGGERQGRRIEAKIQLLHAEGVVFDAADRISSASLYHFPGSLQLA